eukprot:Hpha_TRINITY_DN12427_c0_g1::TRINITY_DN12427_c0_g1_i1::g.42909::m.42909
MKMQGGAALALLTLPCLVRSWGETEDEPGGPLNHRRMAKHGGTGMGRPDCVPCMDIPQQWWSVDLASRGLFPGRKFGPGTKSFLILQTKAIQELFENSNGRQAWPQPWKHGWGHNTNLCTFNSWGFPGGANGIDCIESAYNPPPPGGCGGLIRELLLPHGLVKGTLPEGFKWLVGVQRLEIPGSQLEGSIPDTGLWINMMVLDLNGNKLSGTLPDDFLPAPCLQTLNLRGNQFEGTLPASLGDHTVLMSLNLANNKFEGTFPDLGYVPELAELDLSGNRLSGTLPADWFVKAPRLRWFKVHQNRLSGPVPAGLAHDGSEISVVSVRGNPDMDKMLPKELGTLPLRVFNASDGMTCPSPDMLRHVPETGICGGREHGGTAAVFNKAPTTGPGNNNV